MQVLQTTIFHPNYTYYIAILYWINFILLLLFNSNQFSHLIIIFCTLFYYNFKPCEMTMMMLMLRMGIVCGAEWNNQLKKNQTISFLNQFTLKQRDWKTMKYKIDGIKYNKWIWKQHNCVMCNVSEAIVLLSFIILCIWRQNVFCSFIPRRVNKFQVTFVVWLRFRKSLIWEKI